VIVALLRPLARGLRALFRSRQADVDVADEVAHYLEEATAAQLARGLEPDLARRAARLEVGSSLGVREQVRTSGWEHRLETMLQDIRYAVRRLGRSPVFTVTAVATLALGIGASTAVFSVVNPILIEPLPFPDAHRLVTLRDRNDQGVPMAATFGTYEELAARSHSFDGLAAADGWRPSLTGPGLPERLEGARVTANYFDLFGAIPIAGRGLVGADAEPGAPPVVILSDALAERRFGGARAIVGRPVELDGDPYVVAGVLPPGFANVLAPGVQVWTPLRGQATGDFGTVEWGHHYDLVGRLAPGITPDAASREILAIGRTPVGGFPRPRWADLAQGLLVGPLQESVTGGVRPALLAIIAAVLLLLAIAAVNVANLQLARGVRRRAEFAMRMALGAGRGRLIRQLVTESLVLSLLGGGLGLGVAELGIRALIAIGPPGLPRMDAIRLDPPVFLFAAVLTLLVGVLVGVLPGLGVLGREGGVGGRHTHSTRGGLRSALVVSEVALAIMLLVSAGLLFRSVRRVLSQQPGLDPSGVITMQVVEAGHEFDSTAARLQFFDQVLDAVRRVPGVRAAAFTSQLPLSGEVDGYGYDARSLPTLKPGEAGSALRYAVTPGYFRTMGIPLVAGRPLDATDRPDTPRAVVINQALARRLFGREDPLGERMRFGPEIGGGPWAEVVGVVGDVRHYSLAVNPPDAFYVANGQWEWVDRVETLVVRAGAGGAVDLVPSLRRAVWSVNPHVPILRVRTMESFVADSAGNRRFVLLALEALSLAALVLAAVGLYGVISGNVNERVREIGIRTALGATPRDVVGQVVGHAQALTLAGAGLGFVGAWAGSRLLATLLYDVSPLDPLTYAAVLLLLAGVALVAAWAPARRAVGVDPTVALRAE
jgi:putative ABC transport system permease protein